MEDWRRGQRQREGGEGGEGTDTEGRAGGGGREGAAAAGRRARGITVSAPAEEGARRPASARHVFGLDKRRTEAPEIDCENQR